MIYIFVYIYIDMYAKLDTDLNLKCNYVNINYVKLIQNVIFN